MTYEQALRGGFNDELQKIAGEMQGATRIGIKPIGVERMLEREREATEEGKTPSTLFDMPLEDVAEKVAASAKALKAVALGGVAAGAGGYHYGRQVVKDYKNGRMMRQQSQGY